MSKRNCLIVTVFLVFILATSGLLFGQRVIDLRRVWGDMRVLGVDALDWSGSAVSYGDINGDGYMDIIIGAYGADPGGRDQAGEVYVIFGSSNPPSTVDLDTQSADITIHGDNAHDCCGCAVASGDLNGDNYEDIIIGAGAASPGGRTEAGEVFVIFGAENPPSTIDLSWELADITVYGDNAWDHCGWAIASGDINTDGYMDIIIGASGADPPERSDAGKTYVIFGFNTSFPVIIDLNTNNAHITIYGDDAGDKSGGEVNSGDVNGDGYSDVIIGALFADPGERENAGETYVIFGNSFPSPPYTIDLNSQSADITVYGDDAYDRSGWAVSSGDVNGDGYSDVIIGARYADPDGISDAGETYVVFGGSLPSPPYTIDLNTQQADITVSGDDTYDRSGWAVASGDVNGDGYDDVIIGAPDAEPGVRTRTGETYVVFSSSFPSPPYTIYLSTQSADITVYGDGVTYESGWAVASGDINADGYMDIIIGAHYADPGGRNSAGETNLILGGGAIITAHGLGGDSWIRTFSLLGRNWGKFQAFGARNSQGEVHMAIGDIDGDARDEIAAGHGEGGSSWIRLFEVDGTLIREFRAFGPPNSQGEVHLAIGNFDADPSDKEIAVAQGEGGQSVVKVFEADGTFMRRFRAFGPPNAQGEVHLAAADLENNDGIDEIIAGMGEGGSSLVKVFDYMGTFIRKFRAFGPPNSQGEVHLAAGDMDGDGLVEIAVSQGYGGDSWIRLFEKDGTFVRTFKVFGPGNPNGEVHVTAADMDNDGICEIICGHGEGGSSWVKVYKADGTLIRSFKAFGAENTQGEVHLAKSNY